MIETEKAVQALNDFAEGPAKDAADATADYFEQAGKRIANALETAALSGEFNFRDMAASISRDLAAIAIQDLVLSPLENLFSGQGQGLGGTAQSGVNPVSIVMNISGVSDAGGFQKSQSQISASLARAVAHGQKFT